MIQPVSQRLRYTFANEECGQLHDTLCSCVDEEVLYDRRGPCVYWSQVIFNGLQQRHGVVSRLVTMYMCEFSFYKCSRRVWHGSWTTPTRARGGDAISWCHMWLVHSDSRVALRTVVLQHANQQIFEWRWRRPASRFSRISVLKNIVFAGKTFCISTVNTRSEAEALTAVIFNTRRRSTFSKRWVCSRVLKFKIFGNAIFKFENRIKRVCIFKQNNACCCCCVLIQVPKLSSLTSSTFQVVCDRIFKFEK